MRKMKGEMNENCEKIYSKMKTVPKWLIKQINQKKTERKLID